MEMGDDGLGFDMNPMMNQTPQLFNYDNSMQGGAGSMYDDPSLGGGDETNDAKRRRIARVRLALLTIACECSNTILTGLRYVSQEKDQMRRQNAQVLTLHQLQDGMHFHPS